MSTEAFGLTVEFLSQPRLLIAGFLVGFLSGLVISYRDASVYVIGTLLAGILTSLFINLLVDDFVGLTTGLGVVATSSVIDGLVVGGLTGLATERPMFPIVRIALAHLRAVLHSGATSKRGVGVTRARSQRTMAEALLASAFRLLPGHIRDEFGDEPVHHFLQDWNEREHGRWAWALLEIVQLIWVAGLERMRGAWQAVVQK